MASVLPSHPPPRRFWDMFFCIVSVLLPSVALATPPCEDWVGQVTAVQGRLETSATGDTWKPVAPADYLCPGQSVRTGSNSRAAIALRDHTYMRLAENSRLHLPESQRSESFWVRLQEGIAHFLSRVVHRFEVKTPSVNAMVEGTEFVVKADPPAAVTVIEGQVVARADGKALAVPSGYQASMAVPGSSLRRILIDPNSSVAWAVHYPPLLTIDALRPLATSRGEQELLDQLADLARQGRPDRALALFTGRPLDTPRLQLSRAALMLELGQTERARAQLEALSGPPRFKALAMALEALIEAVNQRPTQALQKAQAAVEQAPDSAPTQLALSYAWQAQGDLQAATYSAREATRLDPDQPLGWTRFAMLQLIQGNYRAAHGIAQRAHALAPDNPQVKTTLGYMALFNLALGKAEYHFRQALALQSSNPDAWLGLGLTQMRRGHLKEGRRHLETAVSLAPTRSVLRSYLGRAYFEETRNDEARSQWVLARSFDPRDPTAPYYLGIQRFFDNDPIGAVAALEQSRSLNDDRAVYRSDGLLQSDYATRSATLARAYGEMGWEHAVVLEGRKALSQAPLNADGHRLLADYYARSPRHEAARLSELLQARLVQPLSAYPVQPQLAESDLLLLEGLGPSRAGLNEYHNLFTQDGTYGLVSALAASDNTLADEAVVSALRGPLSASLGQYHYETDGFRPGAFQDQDIYNGFVQGQLAPGTRLQLGVRDADLEQGDLGLPALDRNRKKRRRVKTYRLGAFTRPTADSGLLLSVIRQESGERSSQELQPGLKERGSSTEEPLIFEAKYVANWADIDYQLGAGRYSSDIEETSQLLVIDNGMELPLPGSREDREFEQTHHNYYAYVGYRVTSSLHLESGLAYDEFKDSTTDDRSQWSPKFGLAWGDQSWTFRLAGFRNFKRNLAANQTLEKTQVVGFNQLYDDFNGTDSRNYAAALDYQSGTHWRTGLQLLYRKARFQTRDPATNQRLDRDCSEQFGELYYSHTLAPKMVFDAAYRYENSDFDFVEDAGLFDRIASTKTHVVPLTLSRFWSPLLTTRVTATYVNQLNSLALLDPTTLTPFLTDRRETGWLFDATLEFKLPRRLGVVEMGAKNLFDRGLAVVDETQERLRFYPRRYLFGRLQMQF